MANVDMRGFWPVSGAGSSEICHRREQVATTYAATGTVGIFTGDPVVPLSTGYWAVQETGATGSPIGSIMQGASYVNSEGNRVQGPYLPPSLAYSGGWDAENASFISIVEQAHLVTFEGQFNAAPTGIADKQENCAHVWAAGSTLTGLSNTQVAYSTHATTKNQWRFMDFVRRPDNDVTLTLAKGLFRINEVVEAAGVAPATGTAGF